MNKVILMGRLTRDPELRATATGTPVASFSLAVNRRFAAKDAQVQADFFNVTAWSKQGEFVNNYYRKGMQVVVIGRLQNRTWEDQEGKKRYATDVILEETYFAEGKRDAGEGSTGSNAGEDMDFTHIDISEDDALPF
ncbi:MAG TPA: single-stranded DNA-binding protein [Clostridia bacterium]|jgi:single-strand DNA-binding protein|nr:MAG: Single-stranded DNA-binding protein ssb [Firmicutes bacterium ADurb.Bin099]HNZ41018.1 single-stranded DNA-binding protein [Clostridia bacterium]HPY97658.1 single-stranded DNA-binding protein [Clostridia bacterium]HQC68827.1 single-stranded DNA-binding protein [Clostridia bacterium]